MDKKQSNVYFFNFDEMSPDISGIVVEDYHRDPSSIKIRFMKSKIFETYIEKVGTYIIILIPDGLRNTLFTIKSFTLKVGKFDIKVGNTTEQCVPIDLNFYKREFYIVDKTIVEVPFSISLCNIMMDYILFNSVIPLHKNCIRTKKDLQHVSYKDAVRDSIKIYKGYKNTSLIETKDKIPYIENSKKCQYCKYEYISRYSTVPQSQINKDYKTSEEKAIYFYKLGANRRYDMLLNIDDDWDYDMFLYGWIENLDNPKIKSIGANPINKWDEFIDILDILSNEDISDLCILSAFDKYIDNHEFIFKLLKRNPSNINLLLLTALNKSADKVVKHILKYYKHTFYDLCKYAIGTTIFMYTYKNLYDPKQNLSKYCAKVLGEITADPLITLFIYEQYGMQDEIPKNIIFKLNLN